MILSTMVTVPILVSISAFFQLFSFFQIVLDFHKVWGGSPDECSAKVNSFFESPHISQLNRVPGSLEALKKLKEIFSLHIVTARQTRFETLTREWLDSNYAGIFDDYHFGNHYAKEGKIRSKAEMCKDINASMLVDDSFVYATQCSAAGIPVLLFGNYPWNSGEDREPHEVHHRCNDDQTWTIRRVHTWEEAYETIVTRLSQTNKL